LFRARSSQDLSELDSQSGYFLSIRAAIDYEACSKNPLTPFMSIELPVHRLAGGMQHSNLDPNREKCVTISAVSRTCQIDACSERVPAALRRHGVCLNHYLDEAFTCSTRALQLCQSGQIVEPRTLDWLQAQGEFTVRLLSKDGHSLSVVHRSRLLELLLCLTNIQEYVRQQALSKV
jgi:hypothetical protein